jgi:hypothetical protein
VCYNNTVHQLNKTLVYFLIFTIISSLLAYKIVTSAYDNVGGETSLPAQTVGINKADLIKVFTPAPNTLVQSPLLVKGEARGKWYFEGSFPISLLDGNGTELVRSPAEAQGKWMTNDFVPFQATLNFNSPTTSTGTLVLKKDNPSGDPAYDDNFSVPVNFSN